MVEMRTAFDISGEMTETPMSRTHTYRKVMKPLLERKRRARINKCLDDLKDLMVHALQHEGESITKLEKADVLELTVRHLRKLKRQQMLALNPGLDLDRFHAGYTACATEVSRCLTSAPTVDSAVSGRLMTHLGQRLSAYEGRTQPPVYPDSSLQQPLHLREHTPQHSSSDLDQGYNSGRDSTPSPSHPQYIKKEFDAVWRPF